MQDSDDYKRGYAAGYNGYDDDRCRDGNDYHKYGTGYDDGKAKRAEWFANGGV